MIRAVAKVYLGFGANIDIITFDKLKDEIFNLDAPVVESFIEENFPEKYKKYLELESDNDITNFLKSIFNNDEILEKYISYTHNKDEVFYVIVDSVEQNDVKYISEESLKKIFKIIE